MASDTSVGYRCLQSLLIWANFVIVCCGIALMAMCIFFVYDCDGVQPLVYATGSNSIWAASWIGIFTGFALFCVSILGMYAIDKSWRTLIIVYLVLMVIIFAFEMASAITAATHKDWFGPNLFLKQMLQNYNKAIQISENSSTNVSVNISMPANNQVQEITSTWNRIMIEKQCCGVYGAQDWLMYDSSFRHMYNVADYPWPRQCCQQDANGGISNLEGCKIGLNPYLSTTGCNDYITGPLITQGLAVSWFGFAILCWTFFVLLGVMFFYLVIEK